VGWTGDTSSFRSSCAGAEAAPMATPADPASRDARAVLLDALARDG
jgi:hypothetical protein